MVSQSRMKTVALSDSNNLSIYNEVLEWIGKCQLSFVTVPCHPSKMFLRYPGLGNAFWFYSVNNADEGFMAEDL